MKPSAFLALLMLAVPALAQVEVYEGCSDASGQPVASRFDPALTRVVESGSEAGKPLIRYNPGALPELMAPTRLFLFAQECAHQRLGHPHAGRSAAQARRADCVAIAGLVKSGLVGGQDDVKAIEADLSLGPDDWARLPGPPRIVDLQACFAPHALRLPRGGPAGAREVAWNACSRRCADRLRAAQRACGGTACEARCVDAFNACEAGCGDPAEAATSSGPSARGNGK